MNKIIVCPADFGDNIGTTMAFLYQVVEAKSIERVGRDLFIIPNGQYTSFAITDYRNLRHRYLVWIPNGKRLEVRNWHGVLALHRDGYVLDPYFNANNDEARFAGRIAKLNNKERTSSLDYLAERIRTWAENKGITENGDLKTQYIKSVEELGELGAAILRNDEAGIRDGLGDVFVTTVISAMLAGVEFTEVVKEVVSIIEGRSGRMVDGAFVKEEDL